MEASVQEEPQCAKYGSQEVGEASRCILKPYGLGLVFVIADMAKVPPGRKSKSRRWRLDGVKAPSLRL